MNHGHFLTILFILHTTDSGQGTDPPPLLIAAAANGIYLYNTSAVVDRQLTKIAPSMQNAVALDYWLKERTVVWSDVDAHTLHIWKYDGSFEGNIPPTVITNNVPHVDGVSIDWVHGLLFRTDFDLMSILVTDLRSMRERVLLSSDMEAPRAIAVDPSCGTIFWGDWGAHRIERAGMNGQDRKIIASGDQVQWPNGLALDLAARRIYWVEANTDTSTPKKGIYSADYSGHDLKAISQSVTFSNPFGIAMHGDRLYWTEFYRHQVLTASKEGEHVSMVVSVPLPTNVRGPWGLRVVHSDTQPESENVCRKSECERLQLCLPTSRLGQDERGRRLYSCLNGAPANQPRPTSIKPLERDTKQEERKGGNTTAKTVQPQTATYPPLLIAANTNGIILYNQSAGVDRDHQLVKLTDGGSGVTNAVAVDYWLEEQIVVWSDVDAHKLYICKYDDSFEWNVSSTAGAPHVDGVAIDWVHGLLFRTDFDLMGILVTDLRSMRERVLLSSDMEAPRAIAVDPSCGTVFWSDWGAHRIERAGMDGQDRKVIASGDQVYWPNGLTLDLPARRMYWVEANTDTSIPKKGIYSGDYWGGDVRTITQSVTFSNPFGIAVHGDRLYWTEFQRRQVLTASKEGGHVSLVVNVPSPAGFRGPWGLRVFHPDAQPHFDNVCNQTDCKQLCLPTSRLGNAKEQKPSKGRLFSCLDGALANASSSAKSPKQLQSPMAADATEQANSDGSETDDKTDQQQATYPPLLIAANSNGINLYNQSAGVDRQLVKLTESDPRYTNDVALDYWLKEKVVVWSDIVARTLHIRKYEGFFNWSKTARIRAPHVDGVAVDWVHGLLFRTDFDLMRVLVLDLRPKRGLRERALISKDLEAPRAIAVDPSCGVLFWSDWGAHRIERAGMDGQERAVIASGDQVHWPNGLALDIPARRIYWVEANGDTTTPKKGIYSTDYWGHDLRTITQSVTFSLPFAIALHGDRLYWTDMQRHQVLSTLKKAGQQVAMVLNVPLPTNLRGPGGLRVFHPDTQPQFKNVCGDAKCEQLCLPTSRIGSAKGKESVDGPLYSCLDGVPANTSSQAGATPKTQAGNTTKVEPKSRETAKEVAQRQTEAALSVILIVVALICLVVAIAALFAVWYLLRRRNQRRKRVIIELSATRSVPAQPSESAHDKWHIAASELTITIECQIGSGAFANVYKGRHGTAIIAVKIPREHSTEARRDLDREIEFMKALGTHPHILKLHGYSELEGSRSVLLLDYCANGDLSHWLLAHPKCLSDDEDKTQCDHHATPSDMCMQLLSFSWQIADGMAYLASRSLIHRDIAARNILLTDEMAAKASRFIVVPGLMPKISDFGMCRRSDGNMYSTKFGKLPIKWMAPESLKSGHFSHKTDVWSYGMLLYELFAAGQIPLSHVQPQEQLAVLERGDRPLKPENCSDEIYALMQRCWRMNPSQRPVIADLMKDLERIIDASAADLGYVELCASHDDIRPRIKRYALYRKKLRISDD